MSQTEVYRCVNKFKQGLMSVADNVHSEWPSALICKGFGVDQSAVISGTTEVSVWWNYNWKEHQSWTAGQGLLKTELKAVPCVTQLVALPCRKSGPTCTSASCRPVSAASRTKSVLCGFLTRPNCASNTCSCSTLRCTTRISELLFGDSWGDTDFSICKTNQKYLISYLKI
jgi:hypothetical protein